MCLTEAEAFFEQWVTKYTSEQLEIVDLSVS
jgi:hypothetical protein